MAFQAPGPPKRRQELDFGLHIHIGNRVVAGEGPGRREPHLRRQSADGTFYPTKIFPTGPYMARISLIFLSFLGDLKKLTSFS